MGANTTLSGPNKEGLDLNSLLHFTHDGRFISKQGVGNTIFNNAIKAVAHAEN